MKTSDIFDKRWNLKFSWILSFLSGKQCMKTFGISYKRWKGDNFITGHEGPEERPHCKAFQQTQTSPPTEHILVFLRWKKFCKDQMMNSQNDHWLTLSPWDVPIVIKTKHPVHIIEMITSDSNIMSAFIFPHGLTLISKAYIKCCSESRKSLLEDPLSGNRILCHATQAGEPSLWLWENFCDIITPNIWPPNSSDLQFLW